MKHSFWFIFLLAQTLSSNPTGEQVVRGDALFVRPSDNELHIHQQNDRAVIEWKDFSIGANELTKFIQPNSESVLLNRVVGQEISKLYGTLEANGQIVLINPHGVIVGETGVINAAAFLSSAYDLSNDDFFDGKLDFSPTDLRSAINVEGRIEGVRVDRIGGRIFLVADEVNVSGEICVPGGEIELNGNRIALAKEGVLDVSASQNGDGGRAIIFAEKSTDFSGTINAKGGSSSGDGGFIEVSSRGHLGLTGNISTMAPNGRTGMFLIDPTNVVISSAGDMNTSGPAYNFTGTPVVIDSANLAAFLNASSVTIDTANTVDQGEPGTLTIDATADFSAWNVAGNSLILLVNSNLDVNAGATIGSVGAGVPGNFLVQAGDTITIDAPIFTNGGNISLRAGPLSGIIGFSSSGSVNLTQPINTIEGGGIGGTLVVQGNDISSTSVAAHQTNSGNVSFFANQDLSVSGIPSFVTTDTGVVTVYANRNITCTPGGGIQGTGMFSGLQIDIRADYDLDGDGDLFFQSVSGNSSGFITSGGGSIFVGAHNLTFLGSNPGNAGNGHGFIGTSSGGSIEVQVRNDFTFIGGSGVGNAAVFITASDNALVRAGNDVILEGGIGRGSSASITGGTVLVGGTTTVIAGNDVRLIGGAAPGGAVTAIARISGDQSFVTAGRDIIIAPGVNASDSATIVSTTAPSNLRAGRDIVFSLGATGGLGQILDNGIGCDVRAGGDIVWARSFHPIGAESIYIQADAQLFPLYPPQVGPYLTGTPLASGSLVAKDFKGAFSVDTSPIGGGIEFVTAAGAISLYSAAEANSGGVADILFDATTINNALRVISTSGDISIGSFHNTDINDTISTAGAILIATNNDMNINAPAGFVIAGGPITLIVDEQTPLTNGGGFFNNFNSGVSTTDPQQRMAIYAASGPEAPTGISFPNQVVLGNLSSVATWDISKPLGLLSKYGTSFEGGGAVHGGGFGASYVAGNGVFSSPVIWYKVFVNLTTTTDEALFALQEIRTEIPERLWVQEFSILVDRDSFRAALKKMMEHQRKESTIQSRYAIGYSKDYFIRATMSGENVRLLDRYQEFKESPFWRTPDMINTLNWLEGVQ